MENKIKIAKQIEHRIEESVHVIRKIEEEPSPRAKEESFDQDDVIVAKMDDRHGVIKSPTEEDEVNAQREKEEAYAELTRQLQEQVHEEDIPTAVDEVESYEPG